MTDPAFDRAVAWVAAHRAERNAVIDRISTGEQRAGDLIESARPGDIVWTTRLLVLLEAAPGASKIGTRRRLASLDIDEMSLVGDLSDDQRRQVTAAAGGAGA